MEGGSGGELSGEVDAEAPLAAADEVVGGVFLAEALGWAGEGEALGGFPLGGEELSESGGAGEFTELLVVLGEVATEGEKLIALWHVDAGGDDELGAGEVEVEAGAGGFWEAFAGPPGGDVVLIGALVRAEAGVAVDAHHDVGGWADVLGGEAEHGFAEAGDEGEHGFFEVALEDGFALVEPVAVVVAFEGAEELEGVEREVRGGGFGLNGSTPVGRMTVSARALGAQQQQRRTQRSQREVREGRNEGYAFTAGLGAGWCA